MSSKDVNEVINNICDKLGVGFNRLTPQMAQYEIIRHWIIIFFALVFFAIGLFCMWNIYRQYRMCKDDYVAVQRSGLSMLYEHKIDVQDLLYDYGRHIYFGWDECLGWITFGAIALTAASIMLIAYIPGLIGWYITPDAKMFRWVVDALACMD